MSPNFTNGAPFSPDYEVGEQEELIWVPIGVPKSSSRSPPTHTQQSFYQPPNNLTIPDASFAPLSWGQDATMMSSVDSYTGMPTSDPTMNWSSSELPAGVDFDSSLELELQAYLDNTALVGLGMDDEQPSPSLFPGSDALFGLSPDDFSGMTAEYGGSPVDWGCSPDPSDSCSPGAASSSPMTNSTISIPPTPVSPTLFLSPADVPSLSLPMIPPPPAAASGSARPRNHQSAGTSRPRRASPTSPREGGSGGGGFRCPLCDKSHLDNRALSRHLWAQHPQYAARTKTKSERAQCPHCDYSGRGDNLARHMKRHAR